MDKKQLLKSCRYYRGENKSPFQGGVSAVLWQVEKDWVERELVEAKAETFSENSSEILGSYRNAGLIDFEKTDGVWVGLKAALYRLLQHWNEGVASVNDWKNFYDDWKNRRL